MGQINRRFPEFTWAQFANLTPVDYDGVVVRISDRHGTTGGGGVFVCGDAANIKWAQITPEIVVATFSLLPTASLFPGFVFYVTELKARYISQSYAGSYKWVTMDEFNLVNASIPVILPPSQTVLTNGTINFAAASPNIVTFNHIYPNAWIYLPASAVSGGSEGLYYCEFSTAQLCQVYTEYVNPDTTDFSPYVPASKTAAVGSNSAYTTATVAKTLLSKTIPGNALGTNGVVDMFFAGAPMNSANTKTHQVTFGGSSLCAPTSTTSISFNFKVELGCAGSASVQFASTSASSATIWGGASGAAVKTTVSTTSDQKLKYAPILANASDYYVLLKFHARMHTPS